MAPPLASGAPGLLLGPERSYVLRSNGEGAVRGWVRLITVSFLTVSLVLLFAIDADGNPLTQDFPNVAMPHLVSGEMSLECGDVADIADDGEQRERQGANQVVSLRRAAHRWTSAVRRWHRSFVTDVPV
jgi:hypothetical protein